MTMQVQIRSLFSLSSWAFSTYKRYYTWSYRELFIHFCYCFFYVFLIIQIFQINKCKWSELSWLCLGINRLLLNFKWALIFFLFSVHQNFFQLVKINEIYNPIPKQIVVKYLYASLKKKNLFLFLLKYIFEINKWSKWTTWLFRYKSDRYFLSKKLNVFLWGSELYFWVERVSVCH